jgi:3-oxoacyl-[acyl-carrier protein] reductase
MYPLEGKVAIVTGASRGIGRAIATELVRAGASVACVSTRAGGCDETVAASGGKAFGFAADVASSGEVENMVAEVVEKLGSVDILVNNAGVARDQLLLRMSDEDWDQVMAVNLKGAFHTVRAVSKTMMRAKWGRIVNISSIVGIGGQAGQANYAASKAGLIGFTKSVARELGSRGITCNAIAPGFIETDMTAELPQEMREHVVKTAPVGRLGTPEDVARLVVFLAGDGAAYITGQVVVVDGGLTL